MLSEAAAGRPTRFARLLATSVLNATVLLLLICAYLLIAFTHPMGDDLSRAGKVHAVGIIRSIADEYSRWSGRWASMGYAYAVSDLVDLRSFYPAALLITDLCAPVATYLLLGAAFPRLPRRSRLVMAIVFFVYCWTRSPALGEWFYWLCGSTENQLSYAMSALVFALAIRAGAATSSKARVAWGGTIAAAALLTTGMHELAAIQLCAALIVAVTVVLVSAGQYRRWPWSVALLAALVGFAVVMAAPGNAVRAALFEDRGRWEQTLVWSSFIALELVPAWVCEVGLLLLTLLFLLNPQVRAAQPAWAQSRAARAVVVAGSCLVLAAGIAGPAWATGGRMPQRTTNGQFLVFLYTWFTCAFALTRAPIPAAALDRIAEWLSGGFQRIAIPMLLALSLLAGPAVPLAFKDLLLDARRYDGELKARYALIDRERGAGRRTVVVPALVHLPRLFKPTDITSDPSEWHNVGAAVFFGVDSIATTPEASKPYEYLHVGHPIATVETYGWPPMGEDHAR